MCEDVTITPRISYDEYTLHMPMALAVLNAFNRSFFYTVVFSFVSFRPTYRFSRTFRLSLATARAEHRRRLRTKEHLFCCKQMQLTVDSNCQPHVDIYDRENHIEMQ
ncbi:hypothetical protein GQX74_014380 [Glossina fuscipes]|nr:hypothetical protein GQX74_014380 [Glossina fuscipes]